LQPERSPSRVLLVEDDSDLAKVILATFERAGIQVHHAATQRKAMELCVASRPDLLILDIALPDGDGYGLVDWLRQQHEMKHLPLVVYSAQDLDEAERKKLRLGPTEFLTKTRVQPQVVENLVLTMLRLPPGVSEVPMGWDGTAASGD
jgi:CheY-like chemotaxis protein